MKKQEFENLVDSIRQAGRIRRGEAEPSRVVEFAPVNVKAVRRRLGKSQSEFARMIGVSVSTLRNWEQGRRRPDGPARALLRVAAVNPEAVAAALAPKEQSEQKHDITEGKDGSFGCPRDNLPRPVLDSCLARSP